MHLTVRSGDVRETITVTPNHPYLRPSDVIGKGVLELVKMDPGGDWTAVLKLKPGDELVSALGVPLVVDSIDVDDAPSRVYSLEVEGLHSFAVGQLAAWVHNARKPKPTKPPSGGGKPQTPDQKALCGLINERLRKSGCLSKAEADIVLNWTKECGCTPLDHRGTTHWVGGSHIHCKGLGGVPSHIPAQ